MSTQDESSHRLFFVLLISNQVRSITLLNITKEIHYTSENLVFTFREYIGRRRETKGGLP